MPEEAVIVPDDGSDTAESKAQKPDKNQKVAAKIQKQKSSEPTVIDLVRRSRDQFELALAGMIDADKFTRVAVTALRTNPKLQECSVPSLLGAFMACAQLGLEPSGPLGHAYLVPFKKEVQLILGYQGLIELAYRSGRVKSIVARTVHENDEFEFAYGIEDVLVHRPAPGSRGAMVYVYAVAHLAGGGVIPVVLSREEVDAIKKRFAKGGASSPWETDYEAMAMKTAVRRLFKWLPSSVEVQPALSADGGVVRGVPESTADFEDVIDVEEA